MAPRSKPSLAILGAGPIGLEIALYARSLELPVRVLERGRIAENMLRWGHVRLFSPWSFNCSPLGKKRLAETGQAPPASEEECPTGRELAERYLLPLAGLPEMKGVIETQSEVVGCGRVELGKRDLIAKRERAKFPFRLLVRNKSGEETFHEADVVVDATGVYGNHNWLGEGGIPAAGEAALADSICYAIPDVLGRDRARYAGKTTVVIGNGASSATAMVALEALRNEAPGTRAVWVCRADAEDPIATLENDKLPQRRELAVRANAIARRSSNGFTYLPGRHVQAIRNNGEGFQLSVRSRRGGVEEIECGAIIANVGYHPDERIYRQLQVHECYATLGPIDLAASLLGQETADCLAIQTAGAEVLKTPEPNFFILGAKSFGTNSAFLMRLGHEQIVQLFTLIMQEPALNLYKP